MGPREATVNAQGKVNLALRVLAREASGYHQLETAFCRLALADSVTVRAARSGRALRMSGPRLPAGGLGEPEQNLAWRAASAYATATGFPAGFEIEIEKLIPVGGGLGGGSADAGGVLRALNALNPSPLPAEQVVGLAGTLGADVPFLTQAESPLALAWGRGERMLALPPLPRRVVWLFAPGVPVSTADAYRWLDEAPRGHRASAWPPAQFASWPGVDAVATNDFQDLVARHVPAVEAALSAATVAAAEGRFGEGALVLLCGSGSTVAILGGEPSGPPVRARMEARSVIQTHTATFVEPVVLTH